MDRPSPETTPDWIETVVKAAGALGFNEIRVRWKLNRVVNRLQRGRRDVENRARSLQYAHKTCPACGSVADKEETTCARCGARLTSKRRHTLEKFGLMTPSGFSMSAVIGIVCLAVYARMYLDNPAGFLSGYDLETLLRFGAGYAGAYLDGQFWRLATACFIHIGLWHIGFNLFALSQIGPAVENLYGRLTTLAFFLATGIIGNLFSETFNQGGVAAGASGGLMGLIGVIVGFAYKDGTSWAKRIRGHLIKWAIYTMVFGFFIGADNWAHGGGFASGAAFGYLLSPQKLKASGWLPARRAVELMFAAAFLAVTAITIWPLPANEDVGLGDVVFDKTEMRKTARVWYDGCRAYAAGDHELAKEILSGRGVELPKTLKRAPGAGEDPTLQTLCDALDSARADCAMRMEDDFAETRKQIGAFEVSEKQQHLLLEQSRVQCEILLEEDYSSGQPSR